MSQTTFNVEPLQQDLTPLERSRLLREEYKRLFVDLLADGADLNDPALRKRVDDASFFMGWFQELLGDTLPGPPDEPGDDDDFDNDAHAPANNGPGPQPTRLD